MARDLDRILDRLRGYLVDGDRITGISTLSTGHSNETYLLEGLDQILRTPPDGAGLLPPYDLGKQFAVMRSLATTPAAPPVPAVCEFCDDPGVIGSEFFTMIRVHGDTFDYEVPGWLDCASPCDRTSMWSQWLSAITRLHNLGPLDTLGPPTTPPQDAQRWREVAEQTARPRLVEINAELQRSPPPTSGTPTIVHGDPKMGNCLWHDVELVALLDWELAHNGEPLADLGYMLSLWFAFDASIVPPQPGFDLDGVPGRQQWIAAWEQQTGRSADGVLRHEAAAHGKLGAIFALGAHLYETGRSPDERFAAWDEGAEICTQAAEAILERT